MNNNIEKRVTHLNTATSKIRFVHLLLLCVLFNISTAYAAQLTIASWNIAWLTKTANSQFSESVRTDKDWKALTSYASKLDVDLLAFQEVDSEAAISKVVGSDYRIFLSQRSQPQYSGYQFDDINQYTGFAVRQNWQVKEHDDLNLNIERNGKLRFATYIELKRPNAPSIHALSIHLKAGCQAKERRNRSCQILRAQGEKLNDWINQREKQQQNYLIMGDFNHNLAYRGDWLFTLLSHNNQAQLATANTKATCEIRSNRNPNQTHQFRSLIDHIIVSQDLASHNMQQVNYSKSDVLNYQLSDHCPLSAKIQ